MQETGLPEPQASLVSMRSLADAQKLASAGSAPEPGSFTAKPSAPSGSGGIFGELGSNPQARLRASATPRSAAVSPVKSPLFSQGSLKPGMPKPAPQAPSSPQPPSGLVSARSLGTPSSQRPAPGAGLGDFSAGLKPAVPKMGPGPPLSPHRGGDARQAPRAGPKPPPPPPPLPPGAASRGVMGGPGAASPQVASPHLARLRPLSSQLLHKDVTHQSAQTHMLMHARPADSRCMADCMHLHDGDGPVTGPQGYVTCRGPRARHPAQQC